ncbi:hypothetical protein CLOM_g6379 [Closterium sp. NIES-68]|nr:hypothetical protein CLOM_g2226 [Closterium sp. NIES-68]GJP47152.1 hypothetical protein CLOM_g6379 [Closterium sp. NIES-68]GJP58686.1 hypothetical protein CLOP_g2276 [Closterium sp. NIES-67]GJP68842.1 hypothetical protein CLOP_g25493 [Closterium sp. NIES-67]
MPGLLKHGKLSWRFRSSISEIETPQDACLQVSPPLVDESTAAKPFPDNATEATSVAPGDLTVTDKTLKTANSDSDRSCNGSPRSRVAEAGSSAPGRSPSANGSKAGSTPISRKLLLSPGWKRVFSGTSPLNCSGARRAYLDDCESWVDSVEAEMEDILNDWGALESLVKQRAEVAKQPIANFCMRKSVSCDSLVSLAE